MERMLKKLEEMAALMSRYITPVTDLLLSNMLSFLSYLAEWLFAVVFPGPDFGKAAVALHSVGPVLSFIAGCTSNDAFFLAFVPGVIAGVGLSIAFEQRQEQRSLARRRKAGYVAILSSISMEDVRKLFPWESLPHWVGFSEHEKTHWLNQQLVKVWPFFNEAYSRMLMESWEPYIDFYKPKVATSVKFVKLTLGTIAPQFKGIHKLHTSGDEIVLDAETEWEGNPSCILSVGLPIGVSVPAQVKDITMTLVLRFIIKPLVDELPCFGAITYLIRKKASCLQEMIRVAIMESLCWPMRACIHVIPHIDKFPKSAVGILDIRLTQARDLGQINCIQSPDAFAMFYIHPVPGLIRRSTTIKNTLNPVWNEMFELEVEDPVQQKLVIFLLDEGATQEFQVLGCTKLNLEDLENGIVSERWLKLVMNLEHYQQVNIEVVYRSYMDEEVQLENILVPIKVAENEQEFSCKGKLWEKIQGVLTVTVLRPENLVPSDYNGKGDPFVNLNPVWNQTFHFFVANAVQDMLIVEVWDKDTFGKEVAVDEYRVFDFMGTCAMTLTKVLQEEELTTDVRLMGVEIGRLFLGLKWGRITGNHRLSTPTLE
ncbi:unnamed protein product [Sphagnum troendelagicum]|uniref:Uncharacterized protein n=1 Tax=Sphagnum troendelagicum TaxID=128251 RepID=A0ABP0TEM7_9BRYO